MITIEMEGINIIHDRTHFSQDVFDNICMYNNANIKGCGMGTLLVLVSPCFRENVVVTCKIGSFLCSLDNLL